MEGGGGKGGGGQVLKVKDPLCISDRALAVSLFELTP